MKKMYVYSGECRLCEIGLPTGFVDMNDNDLHTGDIVQLFTRDKYLEDEGITCPAMQGGLTVVVADQFTTFSDGRHDSKEGELEYFVMGIKSVPFFEKGNEWLVVKVKDHFDVIAGEHWKAYGFNYREEVA